MTTRFSQQGLFTIEFALTGLFFFLFVLVVIDTGRWMMTWALLQESTNRVARAGAIYDPVKDIDKIRRAGLYKTIEGNNNYSSVIPGLTTDHFVLDWLDHNGHSFSPGDCQDYKNIHFVVSKINGFEFTFFSPVHLFNLDSVLRFPDFQVITPGESLGGESCE